MIVGSRKNLTEAQLLDALRRRLDQARRTGDQERRMSARAIVRAPRTRDLTTVAAIMNRIESPGARREVIMDKRRRGVITDAECAELIEMCGVQG